MDFYCYDQTGHTALRAKLRVDTPTDCRIEESDYVELEMKFEPSAMDSFVGQLQDTLRDNEGIAVLQGRPTNTSTSGLVTSVM